ncbi:ABC transporter permease [Lentzea sp. NPDC102401]|uniref:ABC transporter permease n=1 Tax=Lentzea sp. NPDC102401 TaxID=3364128 RepID=UPI00382437BE
MTSAYPTNIDTVVTKVREITATEGKIPARNRVMRECGVGAKKATDALAVVKGESLSPAETSPAPVRLLHSVPTPDTAPETLESVQADEAPNAVQDTAEQERSPEVERPAPVVEVPPANDVTPLAAAPSTGVKPVRSWPLWVIALGAFVSIWGGWVGLGEMTGFGPVRLLPGIADDFVINSAITLPLGVEAYAAYAMRVWLSGALVTSGARAFAKWSAIGSLVLGALGQVAYHLMKADGMTTAPWWITTFVSVLLVVVLGCAAALTHLLHDARTEVRA